MIETAEKYGLFLEEKVSLSDFRKAFKRCGRGDQFSYQGLETLFNYLEEVEADNDEEFELDVEGLCLRFLEVDGLILPRQLKTKERKQNGNIEKSKTEVLF